MLLRRNITEDRRVLRHTTQALIRANQHIRELRSQLANAQDELSAACQWLRAIGDKAEPTSPAEMHKQDPDGLLYWVAFTETQAALLLQQGDGQT